MTDPKRAERIAKLRAILALTNSDQPGEAQAAAEMAAKLKRRWGIEDAELEEGDASARRPFESVWTADELRDQLLDQTPIIAGRHISPDSIRRAGWASWRYPLGLRAWQSTADIGNRPIEGATVIWLEAQFTALECLVVPRLARMYPSWTDGQISRAAADALDGMFTAVDASSLPRMGDLGAFREYLAAHPFPDRWLESAGRPLPERRGAPAPDIDIPRTATIWAALLTLVGGVDDALIDVLLTEWGQGGARRRDQQRTRPAADPFTPPTARVRRDPFAPPSARVSRAPAARDTDTPAPRHGNGRMGMPRLRVGAAVLAVLAALVAIVVLMDQLRDDTTAPPPSAAVDASERVADQSRPAPEPSGDGDAPTLPSPDSPDAAGGGDPPASEAGGRSGENDVPTLGPADDEDTVLPEIVAVCNSRLDLNRQWQQTTSPYDCREEGAAGLRVGSGWGLAVFREARERTNVEYRLDGEAIVRSGETSERGAFHALAPGAHTIEVREQRGVGWSDWSAPYTFTTVHEVQFDAICNTYYPPNLDQPQWPATPADCRTAAADGLRTGSGWDWQPYMRGGVEPANIIYRFDGGAGFSESDEGSAAFDALAPGRHTIEAREQRPWGWTDWSAPYEFETVAVVEVIAICSHTANEAATYAGCKAAEREGFDRSMAGWIILADGVAEWDDVVYRLDGGRAGSEENVAENLWGLAPGQHVVEIRERRSWGWTDWSPPYTFTVR